MERIEELINRIGPPDEEARTAAKRHWDSLARPLGSLGLLEEAVSKLAALRGSAEVPTLRRKLLVFCADNGVVARGVTQCGSDVTAKVAAALAEERSSVSPMAAAADCPVIPVDVGIRDFCGHPGVLNRRIRNGTEDISCMPAMDRGECIEAMLAGAELAKKLAGEGTEMILIGEMGIGNTTTGSAVAATLLNLPVELTTGRGAGLSDAGLQRKRAAIEAALRHNRPNPEDPVDVLTKVGGLDLAAMCGAYLGAAACGVGAVVDGMISAVAALCAFRLCPAAEKAMLASHVPAEPAGERVLKAIGLEAPIHAGLRLGEGSGAVMLLPLLDLALRIYNSDQDFKRLGIEAYVPQS